MGPAGNCSILHDVNPNLKKKKEKKKGMNEYYAVNSPLIYDFVKLILI